jgi:phosphonate transport system permease protein
MKPESSEAVLLNAAQNTSLRHASGRKPTPVRCREQNPVIPGFLIGIVILSIASFLYLDIDWWKMLSRTPDIGLIFWKLAHFQFGKMDLVWSSMLETFCIAVLSLLYSILLGILFGMLAAKNVFRIPFLSILVQSFFTFLRAVPTPVWVLLMMVCIGMGPEAGVAGLCVHTTAFFTKSFSQSFENIPDETVEALEVTGASRLQIFTNAIFPAAFSQIVAWTGMRLETNFSECAILGMVGAGGVGYVISNSLQGYDYGTAGVAIFLVFVTAFGIERMFVRIKRKFA